MILILGIAYQAKIGILRVVLVGYEVMNEKLSILCSVKKVVYSFFRAAIVNLT